MNLLLSLSTIALYASYIISFPVSGNDIGSSLSSSMEIAKSMPMNGDNDMLLSYNNNNNQQQNNNENNNNNNKEYKSNDDIKTSLVSIKTYGDAKVHFPMNKDKCSTIKSIYSGAWKIMSHSLGIRYDNHGDNDVHFSGDLFHRPNAGLLIVIEGINDIEQFPVNENGNGIRDYIKSSKLLHTKEKMDINPVSSIVVPLVQELQKQFPSSLVVTGAGFHPIAEQESNPMAWDNILSEVGGMVRSHRAFCKESSPSNKKCTTKFVADFGSKTSKKDSIPIINAENNVVYFKGPETMSLDAEVSLAQKLVDEFGRIHKKEINDDNTDLLILRFRVSSIVSESSMKNFDDALPQMIKKFVDQIEDKSVVAQIVMVPHINEVSKSASRRRRTEEKLATTPPFQGFDYMFVSWTVVFVALLLFVVFVCIPWSDTLDTTLRSGLKKEFEEKRE